MPTRDRPQQRFAGRLNAADDVAGRATSGRKLIAVTDVGLWRRSAVSEGGVVQAQVRAQVAGAGEASFAMRASMRPLTGVDEVVLLEMGELGESLVARRTRERSLAAVSPKMDLKAISHQTLSFTTDTCMVQHVRPQ